MSTKAETVRKQIEDVLARNGASLFFSEPAALWINGEEVGRIANESAGDGSTLELTTAPDQL
jgi:hypothetical protein